MFVFRVVSVDAPGVNDNRVTDGLWDDILYVTWVVTHSPLTDPVQYKLEKVYMYMSVLCCFVQECSTTTIL